MKSARLILSTTIALALIGSAPSAAAMQPAAPAAAPVALGVGLQEDPEGIKIAMVMPGATAAAIGMQAGDIILEVGGRAATGPQVVGEYVRSLNVGDQVSVHVKRDGRTVELTGPAMPRPEGFEVGRQAPPQN